MVASKEIVIIVVSMVVAKMMVSLANVMIRIIFGLLTVVVNLMMVPNLNTTKYVHQIL